MTWYKQMFTIAVLMTAVACGNGVPSATEHAPKPTAETKAKDQIVLSGEEQTTGGIETVPVEMSDTLDLLRVSGRIARVDTRTWHVGVRTDGLVRIVAVTVGDPVREGQVLARYHADEVREERAKYRTAVSALQERKAASALAKRNFDRAQSLLELKAGSQQQVDEARQDLVAAETGVQNAQIEVDRTTDLLEDDLRVPIEPKPGDEEADLVPIVAPGPGYVLEKHVTVGQTIAPGQDAFVVGDLSQVWMVASVRQDVLDQLRVGQAATVKLPGTAAGQFSGRIINLGQELDPTTRTGQVRIALANPGQRLRPEMLATAEIPVGQARPTLEIPSDAVQQINGQDVVFVRAAADRFTVRPVRVGMTSDSKTPVLDGLTAGEQIVVKGSFVLKSHLLRASMEGE